MDLMYFSEMGGTASDFLGDISEKDIQQILGGLKDEIEPQESDLYSDIFGGDDEGLIEEDEEEDLIETIKGGSSVLQSLISLIPKVFPKKYE